MNILAKLSGDVNVSSTRIRFYQLLKYYPKDVKFFVFKGHDDPKYQEFVTGKIDLLYIQKCSDSKTLRLAEEYHKRSVPIVYDIDVALLDGDAHKAKIVAMSKTVIINVEDLKMLLPQGKSCVYIPDAIDYFSVKPERVPVADTIKTVGTYWNGNHHIRWTKKMFDGLPKTLKKYYVSGIDYKMDNWNFCTWKLDSFTSILKTFDVCVLIHPDDSYGNLKSPNRLLVSMALGIPTFVSPTFSYKKILSMLNLERILIVDGRVNVNLIKSRELREEISVKLYNYAWKMHNPEMIAKKMYEVFKVYAR